MRLALGVLVAGITFMAGRGRSRGQPPQPWHRGDKRDDAVQRGREPPAHEQPGWPALQAPSRQQETGDSPQQREDRRYRWWSLVVSAVSAIATATAAIFAYGAYSQARRQADIARDAYLASNRAWFDVSVDPEAISLRWRDGVGATLYAKLEGVNNGGSPAIEARLTPTLVVDKGMFDASPREVVRNNCKQWSPLNGGDIVFKDERITYSGPAFVAWNGIKAVLERPLPRDAIEEHARATGTVMFYFVACAMYRIAGDNEWHHTGRIYHLGRMDDLPDGERVSLYLRPGDDLNSDRLVLTNPGVGAYAD